MGKRGAPRVRGGLSDDRVGVAGACCRVPGWRPRGPRRRRRRRLWGEPETTLRRKSSESGGRAQAAALFRRVQHGLPWLPAEHPQVGALKQPSSWGSLLGSFGAALCTQEARGDSLPWQQGACVPSVTGSPPASPDRTGGQRLHQFTEQWRGFGDHYLISHHGKRTFSPGTAFFPQEAALSFWRKWDGPPSDVAGSWGGLSCLLSSGSSPRSRDPAMRRPRPAGRRPAPSRLPFPQSLAGL